MKPEKVRELDANELRVEIHQAREQLFRLRFQLEMGQSDGLKKYRELRKGLARLLTVQRQREAEEAAKG